MTVNIRTSRRHEGIGSCFIIFIVVFFLGVRYMFELIDEPTDLAPSIIGICNGLAEMNNDSNGTGWPLCDPNDLIVGKDKVNILTKINQIESYYDLRYELGVIGGDTDTSDTTNDIIPRNSLGSLKITVFVIDETNLPFFFSAQDECEYISDRLLDSMEKDGITNIVLLLTKKEHGICMACSKKIKHILTPGRVDDIMEQAKGMTWHLNWIEADLVDIVEYCLNSVLKYLEEGEPSFIENNGWFIFVGLYLLFYFCNRSPRRRQTYGIIQGTREKIDVVIKMSEEDREEALSLMKRYQCLSCPICLEDYEESSTREDCEHGNKDDYNSITRIRYLGCDGEPIQLLRCGHSACHGCWNEWTTIGVHPQTCPVCKKDIRGQ
mmetsp:Transcript_24084/g.35848  ORF Transcript_24084/g.35848 Transcript_24084/m.35848 type:complete len:379 (-) Transcript_24084:189-1325(-)